MEAALAAALFAHSVAGKGAQVRPAEETAAVAAKAALATAWSSPPGGSRASRRSPRAANPGTFQNPLLRSQARSLRARAAGPGWQSKNAPKLRAQR